MSQVPTQGHATTPPATTETERLRRRRRTRDKSVDGTDGTRGPLMSQTTRPDRPPPNTQTKPHHPRFQKTAGTTQNRHLIRSRGHGRWTQRGDTQTGTLNPEGPVQTLGRGEVHSRSAQVSQLRSHLQKTDNLLNWRRRQGTTLNRKVERRQEWSIGGPEDLSCRAKPPENSPVSVLHRLAALRDPRPP